MSLREIRDMGEYKNGSFWGTFMKFFLRVCFCISINSKLGPLKKMVHGAPLFKKNCLNKLPIFHIFHFKQIFIGFLGHSKQKSTPVIFL